MTGEVDFKLKGDQAHYVTGQTVSGNVEVVVPAAFKLEPDHLKLSFRCVNETRWPERKASPDEDQAGSYVNCDKYEYLNVELPIKEKDIFTQEGVNGAKKLQIPFSYTIPKDSKLPSTLVSTYGTVQYFLELVLKLEGEVRTFTKEVTVRAPNDTHLMIAVVGTASKYVLLHNGTVSMTASIPRKGYAPGQIIHVTLDVSNKTNVQLTPRLSLNQTQIYMHGSAHKSVESSFNEEPFVAASVEPDSEVEEMIQLKVPDDEALTITSAAVSVKYYVHISLGIPQAFNLHLNLPLIITSKEVMEEILAKEAANESKLLKK